ncbi:MAG: TVP38/TMEM64 family protein [Gammaproteobacteria bacterium]|nr:TVP38/TMEM64 family protein [Gammaproteobacteria bacterium]
MLGKALAVGAFLLLVVVVVLDWLALAHTGPLTLDEVAFSPEALVDLIRGWGTWGVAGSVGLMVLHSFVPFPAECLAIANGMVFGFLWGTVITWSGAMLGAWLAFGLARALGRPFVDRMVPARHLARIDTWSGRHGWSALLAARLMPVIAFNLINYAAGLVRVSWWTFTWTTALGILPLTLLMVLLGERMAELPAWAWGALILGAVLVWLGLHRWRRRTATALPGPRDSLAGDRTSRGDLSDSGTS